jgi:pimeloyl-ACP methyl ester carboxylesterase
MMQPTSVRELRTLVDSVKLPANLRKIRDRRDLGGRTLSEVGALISVESDFDSNLVTLVATGENDVGSNARMARMMHDKIGGSKLVILPRLRHSLLVEAPDKVAELLLDFLG